MQAVAGQMLGFFAEIGCVFPQFPYIAHSRGWSAEDMERNVALRAEERGAARRRARARRPRAGTSRRLLAAPPIGAERMARGGRKAHGLANEMPAQPMEPPAEPIPALEGV